MIPKGFRLAGARCGLKNRRRDIGMIVSDGPIQIAGLLTSNQVRSACVDHTRKVVERGVFRALVVNSGNANCCTGEQGARDAAVMAEAAAKLADCSPVETAVASTGVIGKTLDMAKVHKGIGLAHAALGTDPKPFMEAILTTDLVEKEASFEFPGGARIYGVAKGSGMIAPNMATMLAFVMTDAVVDGDLQSMCRRAADQSFHRVTVDSDTSTNDMFLLLSSGASGVEVSAEAFEAGLTQVCLSLAKQIARDGEGASKLLEITVTGTNDPDRLARSIADSPLVKTAMFGCDPNWGRIIAAAGKCGEPFDPAQAVLKVRASGSEFVLFEHGVPTGFDPAQVSAALKSDEVVIDLYLGDGKSATVYSCDLGYGYIRINAEYHT